VIKPIVGAVVPFRDTIKAYERVMTGHTRGKIVLDMTAG
jgi:NADPH:quinone reductase-like Zn-dependent oxidoreductase